MKNLKLLLKCSGECQFQTIFLNVSDARRKIFKNNMSRETNLLELNHVVYLTKHAEKQDLEEDEKEKFIQKYNKISNRLFTPCKKYKIDEYKMKVKRYESRP